MTAHADVAERIARTLVEDAIWYEGRCTWVGATGEGAPPLRETTLPADLYEGVAGVGLFLAHLAEVSGDHALRCTARGAILQALRCVAPSEQLDDGLHAGALGVALAAVRAGSALADEEIGECGARLARACVGRVGTHELDLVLGASGRIVAMLTLHAQIGGDTAIDAALVAAGELVARAADVRLTGLSHGMSGAGLALLELGAATGEPDLRDAGRAMLTAEREYLDRREGNWADLRHGEVDGVHSYAVAWCHGAPGIALARLRALELTGDPRMREEALIALRTTDRYARAALQAEGFDLTPLPRPRRARRGARGGRGGAGGGVAGRPGVRAGGRRGGPRAPRPRRAPLAVRRARSARRLP